jgi:hypothetical protein
MRSPIPPVCPPPSFAPLKSFAARADQCRVVESLVKARAKGAGRTSQPASIMNIRDRHLAHSLERTRREKRGAVTPMKYGDESTVLELSMLIVEPLYCWVNGKVFQSKKRAESTKRTYVALARLQIRSAYY